MSDTSSRVAGTEHTTLIYLRQRLHGPCNRPARTAVDLARPGAPVIKLFGEHRKLREGHYP